MSAADLQSRSAFELAELVRGGEVSAREVAEAFVSRTHEVEGSVRALVRWNAESALEQADRLDADRARGRELGPLAGVPVAIKDNLCLTGAEVTCGSQILRGYESPYDATAVARLLAADCVILGQANMDEFAMGSSCENSSYHPTCNPWDLERVPGGSSGGSAAAVAGGEVPLALGTDTGGSIRQPAALCGVVGLKPSYGRVSRWGLIAFASSLDQIGPLSIDVRDASLALGVLAGVDEKDSTSSPEPVADYVGQLEDGIDGLRVGVLSEIDEGDLDAGVLSNWRESLAHLESCGATLEAISIPSLKSAIAVYYVVANSEASANLARFDGMRYGHRSAEAESLRQLYDMSRSEGFGDEVKRRILLGTFALSSGYYEAYYGRALGVAARMKLEFEQAFGQVDLIVTPTSPTAAFRIGERVADPLAMYLSDVFTTPASLVGLPGLAVPSGFDASGLPLSLQILGRPFAENQVLRAGRAFERAAAVEPKRPEIGGRPVSTT